VKRIRAELRETPPVIQAYVRFSAYAGEQPEDGGDSGEQGAMTSGLCRRCSIYESSGSLPLVGTVPASTGNHKLPERSRLCAAPRGAGGSWYTLRSPRSNPPREAEGTGPRKDGAHENGPPSCSDGPFRPIAFHAGVYAWNELPQPQDFTALGLSNVKPRRSMPS
jgi:hypothetical protein